MLTVINRFGFHKKTKKAKKISKKLEKKLEDPRSIGSQQ